jgi:hypothetical protein
MRVLQLFPRILFGVLIRVSERRRIRVYELPDVLQSTQGDHKALNVWKHELLIAIISKFRLFEPQAA